MRIPQDIPNDKNGAFLAKKIITEHYKNQNRLCKSLGCELIEGGYDMFFLIDMKYVFSYFWAFDTRNFFSAPAIGIGPCYIDPDYLLGYKFGEGVNINSTTSAIEHNLKLLDSYFDKQTCCTCQNNS